LERRNATLSHKLQQVEHEKVEISRQEKDKIQSLISEFEFLRAELDLVKITELFPLGRCNQQDSKN
jgi:hypothetical protein